MKKLLTIVALSMMLTSQANNHDKQLLTVEGKFVAQKSVECKVYEIQQDSSLKQVYSKTNNQYFSFVLETGSNYVVRFTACNNVVKELIIEADESGDFQLLVDFNKTNNGLLKYNDKKSVYELKSLPTISTNAQKRCNNNRG